MAAEPDAALAPLAAGRLLRIACGTLSVIVAPAAGGRIAQIIHDGVPQLVGPEDGHPGTIAWGCYPMVPWAGRVRDGSFRFDGRDHTLTPNLGAHAIHGVGFALPWTVELHTADCIVLALRLPCDARWPFGGAVRQTIRLTPRRLRLTLRLDAGQDAMPAVIGWHPWFRKPDRVAFAPAQVYPRDAEGLATLPLGPIPTPPWDDCFVGATGAVLHREGHRLQLSSDCSHWVVYDAPAHATCIEPQSGPPDGFNLEPFRLEAGARLSRWFEMAWGARHA
ncbi:MULTISPECIES: aldose epimerase [Luteimonas]|uniref:Aldose 1-epimerase n=1 Tax=Luteimonas terrae TaxID=1530191 RepID=A0ABU1XTF3_9GAMM|nr:MULTISPECIES: aldose epimerase [Luteimonas]MDR6991968.1 aldose 1-epimerase [Luteimonas sp. 3794]MDR7191366.1 aldose 1-epimerase [Luteimonas terrae]